MIDESRANIPLHSSIIIHQSSFWLRRVEGARVWLLAEAEGAGGGVGFDVGDADVPAVNAQVGGDAGAFAGEADGRLAAFVLEDFDVGPGDSAAPAGAENFEDGFLGGE